MKALTDTLIIAFIAGMNVAASVFVYKNTSLSPEWSVFLCSLVLMAFASLLVNQKQSSNIETTKPSNPQKKKKLTSEHKSKLSIAASNRPRKNGKFVSK